jgi:formylglycine-generating enzyme required for sulfatase activity
MKSCPTCKRTFDDTMTFCLVDGSILSAPFDPQATEHLPSSRNSDPARTEILHPAPNTANSTRPPEADKDLTPPPQTIRSPASEPSLQETTASPVAQEYSSTEGITSQSAMKTMKAAPPEVMIRNSQRASSAAETSPTSQLTQTRSNGGKRLALIAGALLLVTLMGGIAWLFYEKVRKESPVATTSQQAQQNENKPQLTGQPFTESINGAQLQMVYVPGGTFLMGSPLSETGRDNDEGPQSNATVPNFYMSKHEVTQAQYKAVIGTNPSSFKGDDLPVDSVSWNDAIEFCSKLSRATGREYRLPTEAEWEYASRAGTTGPYAGNIDALTWYSANSGSQPHPVGQKQPNGLGLYDMYGNVWEWCQSKYKPYPYNATDGREDLQSTEVRVLRGGSWESSANSCRSAYRRRVMPDARSIGFRIVLARPVTTDSGSY